MATTVASATLKPSLSTTQEPPPSVPIFLRKTYHMINTCDSAIACWSDDGETFVVKDPIKFEQVIIPQFFKHSKFSSFVRQLNFYSFRKLKYADTLRIDPVLEAETANYWKFRHENFRRGKPELLTKIKRMNGQKGSVSKTTPVAATSSVAPLAVGSSSVVEVKVEEKVATLEVQSLKKKIEEMTKNIDELAAMVQKVSLRQDEQESKIEDCTVTQCESVGNKRKKTDCSEMSDALESFESSAFPDATVSLGLAEIDMPDIGDMSIEALPFIPEMPLSMPLNDDARQSTQSTDTEFVDQLFDAFADENDDLLDLSETDLPEILKDEQSNQPDPDMMKRLSDALMLLPRDIQEMIVDKLIAAITGTDFVSSNPATTAKELNTTNNIVQKNNSTAVATAPLVASNSSEIEEKVEISMPLAAATLAALLRHYSAQVEDKKPKNMQKTMPVIPVHA